MEHTMFFPTDKSELYPLLLKQVDALIDGRRHAISTLSNAAALIYEALGDVNWAGFYLMHEGALLLGPFVGRVACVDIPVGRGVCGTAVARGETLVVPDVHEFPGHIACDAASASEIVVPLRCNGRIVGVMDIDCPHKGRFDEVDRAGLEAVAAVLGELDYDNCGY
jgi:L-methionine (R)-S-oxide reductase